MPTPSSDPRMVSPLAGVSNERFANATCPSEEHCQHAPREERVECDERSATVDDAPDPSPINNTEATRAIATTPSGSEEDETECAAPSPIESVRDTPSPISSMDESKDIERRNSIMSPPPSSSGSASYSDLNSVFRGARFVPNSTSSFLRPGSKFHGTQQSDRQIYDVQVEMKHVDMAESFLCGYLRIQGLTDDHPTLTTYFEGEIIGTKYTFLTRHTEWGSCEKTDMMHWNRFPAWKPLAKQAKRSDFSYKNYAQRENIFMRWKEHFLVPDHRVRAISGASFEGFYYICFNQVTGAVSGIYFHAKSERYQALELKHVDDRGCSATIEFR